MKTELNFAPSTSVSSSAFVTNERALPANSSTFNVRVGAPGNVRNLSLGAAKSWTVGEVLSLAEIDCKGYDLRVNGAPANGQSRVSEGQTILLLAPVRGN